MPSTNLVYYCDLLIGALCFTANQMLIVYKNIDIQQGLKLPALGYTGLADTRF